MDILLEIDRYRETQNDNKKTQLTYLILLQYFEMIWTKIFYNLKCFFYDYDLIKIILCPNSRLNDVLTLCKLIVYLLCPNSM